MLGHWFAKLFCKLGWHDWDTIMYPGVNVAHTLCRECGVGK